MSSLVHKLGLATTLSFHDVFSIDDAELLAFVPRPAVALLLVFPVSEIYETYRLQEDASRPVYEGSGPHAPIIWYRQTIRNACGLIGLLHAVSNGGARKLVRKFSSAEVLGAVVLHELISCLYNIEPDSDLAKLIADAEPLAPTQRADLLYNSEILEQAHGEAAQQGQSNAPDAGEQIDLHYVCFIKDETNHLWELDGRRKGPLDRGELGPDEDVLSERALELGPRPFMKREEEAGGGEMRFSLVTLAPSLD